MGGRAGEFERIALLQRVFGPPPADVPLGIGDDAALLHVAAAGQLAWTVDAQVEGRHFVRGQLSPADIAYRAFTAAASDLAAMGAEPWCALTSWVLPRDVDDAMLAELARGTQEAAAAIGAAVVGGNLSSGGEISLTTTLLGKVTRPLSRGGAKAGQGIWLAGPVGLAAAGWRLLAAGRSAENDEASRAFRRPTARIAEGRSAALLASAAIDVSDGLVQDLGHLAAAGQLGFLLDEGAILTASGIHLTSAARALGLDPLELALYGGEDYALLATSAVPLEGFHQIGTLRPSPGARLRGVDGQERSLETRGFNHFR